MADTVKTSALKAIRSALEKVSGMGDVIANPFSTLDLETVEFPAAFVYDEPMNLERRNQTVRATLPLHIEVWCEAEDGILGDEVDELAAEIEKALLADTTVLLWCRDIAPEFDGAQAKFFTSDRFGGIALRYSITFDYTWGDPFDHGR